jgi:hypothetical protein
MNWSSLARRTATIIGAAFVASAMVYLVARLLVLQFLAPRGEGGQPPERAAMLTRSLQRSTITPFFLVRIPQVSALSRRLTPG